MCMSVWSSLHCNHALEREGRAQVSEVESTEQGCNMVDSAARASQMVQRFPKVRRIEYYRQGL